MKRIICNVFMMAIAYILIAVSCIMESDDSDITPFIICIIASIIHGLTASFGASVILGYLKGFPPDLVVGWSSGTGFAGVVGAGMVVLLFALEFQLFTVIL